MANWFVGLPVNTEGWLEELLADAPERVRRFHPEDVHITVAFLGSCGERRARAAWELREAYDGAPFEVRLGHLAPMGNPRRPSALSLLLTEGREEAAALISALRAPMIEAAEARPDDRPPKPHVTVARPARKATEAERREALRWAEEKPPVNAVVPIDRVALYTWSDDRPRRQFRVVDSHVLGER